MALKPRGNIWYVVMKFRGTLHRVSTEIPVGTRANRETAERRAAEIELQIRKGAFGWAKDVPTFAVWWKTYEATYLPRKRPGTQRRDRGTLAHALPVFGSRRLDQITKSDCMRYLNQRRKDVHANPGRKRPGTIAEGTVQRERSLLQAIFQQAIEDGILDKNPWRGIERVEYAVRDRVLSSGEQEKLLAVLSPRFQRFVLVLLGTGLRLDECRGIRVATDLDLVARTVRVTGKFRKARIVTIPVELAPVLQAQLDEDGKLWDQNPQRLREVLAAGARRAKIDHLSPHTLRHTFGHRWLKSGGDIYALSKVLGHGSVSVTERHYAHLLREDLQAAVDARDLGIGVSVAAMVGTIQT